MVVLGTGLECAMISIYVAECSLADLRGALVVMRQMSGALGIVLGYMAGVVSSTP